MKPHLFKALQNNLDFLRDGLKTSTTYVPIAKTLGVFSGGAELAGALGEVQDIDQEKGRPFRSSLVIGVHTGVPGPGYFVKARSLGHAIGTDPVSEFLFWAAQMKLLGVPIPASSVTRAKSLGISDAQLAA